MIKEGIIYNDYHDWQLDIVKARGEYIWTKDGRKLIDFTSGWNVTNLGWNNPEISGAVMTQLKKNVHACAWAADPIQNRYSHLLTRVLPKELCAIGRATGGTDANEQAILTARSYTKRRKILGFRKAYHGQSRQTMSLGYLPKYMQTVGGAVRDIIQMDFPDASRDKNPSVILERFTVTLDKLLSSEDVAAIVTECGIITGWGSTPIAPKGFLASARKITKKYGTLLILDEVGTGFSRCGKLFGMELEGIIPDIVTLAKGMSNGVAPIGTMVTTTKIAEKTLPRSSTFSWLPVACAASLKTLEIHMRDKMWEKAYRDGIYVITSLQHELKSDERIAGVRGMGMEIGISFAKPGMMAPVVTKAMRQGLHIIKGDDNTIQLMPPLTISKPALDQGINILVESIKSL